LDKGVGAASADMMACFCVDGTRLSRKGEDEDEDGADGCHDLDGS
jgi:hypothetical protein